MLTLGLVALGMISVITWVQQQSTARQLEVTERNIKEGLDRSGQGLTENHALALEGFIEEFTPLLTIFRDQFILKTHPRK